MRIAQFEATGLNGAANVLEEYKEMKFSADDGRELLKICNVSFVLEGINRLQSMLICELRDSYVQQSQRYVTLAGGVELPPLEERDMRKAERLLKKSFSLYAAMAEKKAGDFKGRPRIEQYVHGIPIEDARYILPLAAKTNVCVSMSGDKLLDFYALCLDERYALILADVLAALERCLPPPLHVVLCKIAGRRLHVKILRAAYKSYFDQVNEKDTLVLLARFRDMDSKAGLGALTSTSAKPPSEFLNDWKDAAKEKAAGVTRRVLGYGHTSIAEQARATFGMMYSLAAYHQQLRHRLTSNVREELSDLVEDAARPVKLPPSIANTPFAASFLSLADEFKAFRCALVEKYGDQTALYFLLNCDQIKLLMGANARAETAMLAERACMNAQWEIRALAIKKIRLLRRLSPVLYESALPSCVMGACREGKMTCGRADEVRKMFADLEKGGRA